MEKLSTESIEEYRHRVRSYGETLKDSTIFETNLVTGVMNWVNEFALSKTGYSLDQLRHMHTYDLMPARWHSELSERLAGKRSKYFVLPIKTTTNQVTWWFCEDFFEEYPDHWYKGRYMTTTGVDGHEFEVLGLLADTANKTGEILYQFSDIHAKTESSIQRLDNSDSSIRKELHDISRRLGGIQSATQDSANHSVNTNQKLISIQNKFEEFQSSLTSEILSLLSSDKAYEKRISEFNEKVNARISDFEEEIKETSRLATKSIELQASQVGKTLSKKITFPISVVSGLVIIIAQLLEHPEIMAKIVDWFSKTF